MPASSPKGQGEPAHRRLSEDWLAVLLAFALILLSVIGILGENGLNITF